MKTVQSIAKIKTKTLSSKVKSAKESMELVAQKFGERLMPIHLHEVIEVTVLQTSRNRILVDVLGLCLGVVPEKEFSFDVHELKPGDKILAQVLALENDQGQVVLSLRRADRERIWKTLDDHLNTGEPLDVKVVSANRGGLMVNFGGLEGFLPLSHLSTLHYPRVEGGDTNQILAKLKPLIGQVLRVKVITIDRKATKLIFSERAAGDAQIERAFQHLKVGQTVEATISGIVDFGLFVTLPVQEINDSIEGLIHISEIAWNRKPNLQQEFQVGQKIKAMIISLTGGRVALSLKNLLGDPWEKIEKALKIGDQVSAEVTQVTPFGAFVRVKGLEGMLGKDDLIEGQDDPLKLLSPGQKINLYVKAIEPQARRLFLTMKPADKKPRAKASPKQTKTTTKQSKTATQS